jgi:tetratricopeptide (TPR) repeat protein
MVLALALSALSASPGEAQQGAPLALEPGSSRADSDPHPDPDLSAPPSAPGTSTPSREAPRESIELFQRARDHYQNGRYAQAAGDLERALALDPGSPTLLYNLARVYELSGEHERAVTIYQRYLEVIPESDLAERQRTELAIRRLEGAQEYTRPDEEAYSQTLYVQQRGVADELFWTTLVIGGVATLVAVGLAIATSISDASLGSFVLGPDGDLGDREDLIDRTSTLALATDVTGGVAGGVLLGAVLLWVLRERTVELYPDGTTTAWIDVGDRGTTIGARGRW